MKMFSYFLVFAFIVAVIFLGLSLLRFAYVRIKAFVIRRKLSNLVSSETYTEKNDD